MRGKAVISLTTAGERFAQAIATKDGARLRAVLADEIDFQALTPGRAWQAASALEVADNIVFGRWFADAEITELLSVVPGQVADRGHVSYRLAVHKGGVDYLVEQQAYYDSNEGGRIMWLRILCSGYQPDRSGRPT